jgi:acyl-CoA synthetase (AMP-forming)/AMP-acid ligase II
MGGRVRYAVSGSAPLGHRLGHFYRSLGIKILEGYGLTETTAPASVNLVSKFKIGTVGPALPGVGIRIADDGEIQVTGVNVFAGYWNNDAATREAMDGEWFKTAEVTLKQDQNRSLHRLFLRSPKADGTERKNGYTVVINDEKLFLMEVFTPGVYRSGTTTERDSILRRSAESGLMLQLGYALAGQADTLLGSGALSLPWWGWILMTVALGAAFLFALRHSRQIEERLLALISKAEAR